MSRSPKPDGSSADVKSVARTINQTSGSLGSLTPEQHSVLRNQPRAVLQFVDPPYREALADNLNVTRLPDYLPLDNH
jgi:hypothetical protein